MAPFFVNAKFRPRDRVRLGPHEGIIFSVVVMYNAVTYNVQVWDGGHPETYNAEEWEIQLIEAFSEAEK